MRLQDLPNENDRNAVAKFAMSFDLFRGPLSPDAVAQAKRGNRRETLDDLRAELHASFRGSNHRMDDLFLETYRELLPHFREKLAGIE